MDMKEIQELAKAAAHSAILARYSERSAIDIKYPVDEFLSAYEYAMIQLRKKYPDHQSQLPPEFRTGNQTKIR